MRVFTSVITLAASVLFVPVAAEAACTSTKATGSIRVGSSITGGSVLVCASETQVKSVTTTKTTSSKKLVAPKKVAPPPCVIKVSSASLINDPRVPGCTYLVVAPPKAVVYVPKPIVSKADSISTQNDQAAFTPNPVSISSSATTGTVGQVFFFSAIASAHSRSGVILGKPARVTFTPVSFDWSSDVSNGNGVSFSSAWTSEGSHSVSLTVAFSVSYSLGGDWIDAGLISSAAAESVTVTAAPAVAKLKAAPPLLVSANCFARPSGYGC